MGCAKKKMAKGGMVKRRKGPVAPPMGYAAGGFAVSDDPFFAPDPNMYRNDAKNMANVQAYIKEQGGEIPGQRQKPTAADVLGKFQAGQPLGDMAVQPPAPAAPIEPRQPEPPGPALQPEKPRLSALPQSSGGLGINLDNSMGLSTLRDA